ncbi:MAG: LLM class flavin-dependent oxidoreductase [Nocardioides sp.]|uniref:LLM class flavin-dependent oxidoreductase n=1 Tax=Nocardioides sp. TaxID=35761 RepID=UPI0039E28C1B
MHLIALLTIGPADTASGLVAAAGTLRDAGVDGVGFLDAQDLGTPVAALESSTLATLVGLTVPGIGVIGSQSGLYGYPFHTARRFATLDHLSAGWSGWLLRTGSAGSEASALDRQAGSGADGGLARAGEHAEIGYRLWDSWEDGAQWPDKESGNFKDDSRIHAIDYASDRFQVEGPLDVPPSPQHRPVVLALVSSPDQVAALGPWIDVAVVLAPDEDAAVELAAAVRADGRIPKVLLACGAKGLPIAAADQLAAAGVADGLAPVIDTTGVADVAALATAVPEPPDGTARTFAERLGIGPLPVGGRTA